MSLPKVKIVNPDGTSQLGTQCFVNDTKIPNVRAIDFHVSADECPIAIFEVSALPDIEMQSSVAYSFSPRTVIEAVEVLRHELLLREDVYDGFKASLAVAIEKYCTCGLPFEPEAEMARKILDFLIGEEK